MEEFKGITGKLSPSIRMAMSVLRSLPPIVQQQYDHLVSNNDLVGLGNNMKIRNNVALLADNNPNLGFEFGV